MEKTPLLAGQVSNYGIANPEYTPASPAMPAMSSAPAAQQPSAPSALSAGIYDVVPGYEGTVAGGGGFLPPPMPTAPLPGPESGAAPTNWNISNITEDAAHKAFISYASSKCCYSSAPAREGFITAMEPFNTYRYRLATFAETRSTEWCNEPYTGQPVDAFLQPAPSPWEVAAQKPTFFQEHMQKIRVPYTSSLKNCYVCLGVGRQPCKDCAGSGNKVCWVCKGSGFRLENQMCTHCQGRGRENCSRCRGNGNCQCDTCHGKRQLLTYILLKVQWTTYKDDYVVEQMSGLHQEKLKHVSGRTMFKDSQHMLYPLMGFPDPALSQASQRLIQEHQSKYFQTSCILQQRHTIELIPITRVSYSWKGKDNIYYVFGNELCVHTDSYPATCCCCSVM